MEKGYKISKLVSSKCEILIYELTKRGIEYSDCDIYTTPHNTQVFDWEIGDDVFSLEIGKDTVGYFVEIDGMDDISVDNTSIYNPKIYDDLKSFLE